MPQTNLEVAIEVIGQAINEYLPKGDSTKDETRNLVNKFLQTARNSHVLFQWPESQEIMEEEEAIFVGGSEDKTGSSAYLLPIERVLEL